MFCEKKNLSVRRKKIFKVWKGRKNISVEFRVFEKKGIERKGTGKKSKCFFLDENLKWRILLSSCSLVGLYVSLQVKVTEKKWKFFKVFFWSVFKLRLRFAEKGKVKITVIAGVGLEPNHVWAPCCKTWLKFEIQAFRCKKKKVKV